MAPNDTNASNVSTTSNTVSNSFEQTGLSILLATWKPNLVVSVASLIGVATNLFVMVTIAKTKELHNKSQFVIFSHSLAEALYALFAFIMFFRKYLLSAIGKSDVMDQLGCIFFLIPLVVASKAALYAILALCVDRLLAIGLPIKYKNLRPVKYVVWVNAVCWGAVFLHVPFFFLEYKPGGLVPICNYAFAVSITYRNAESTESNFLPFFTIFAYGLAIGIVSFRYWGKKWQNEAQRSTWARQVQMGAFRMMMTVGCLYLVLWGISQGINYAMTYANPATAATVGPYVVILQNINSASHFFVYFSLSKRFRQSCMTAVFCRTSNAVESLA